MLRTNRVIFKLIAYVVLAFAVATGSVMLIANHRIKQVINANQALLYAERLDAIINVLEHHVHRLEATGWRESYEEDFKKAALETLASTYYQQPSQLSYPFILDDSGNVVLHPQLAAGSRDPCERPCVRQMLAKKSGDFNFIDAQGQEQWFIFRHFDSWDWIVAYVVPCKLKYAQARLLRNNLTLIMVLIVLVIVTVLLLVIGRMIRPVTELTRAASAFADGRMDYPITVSGADEFRTLATSFVHMRDAVNEKISELAAKNKALSESEARFRLLIDQAADSVLVHDLHGRVLTVNRQACDSLGYSREELAALSMMDIDRAIGVPEEATRRWCNLRVREPLTLETSYKRKDGSAFPVEVRIGLFESRKEKLILALARDITERKRAEVQLCEEKEKFQILVEGSPFGVSLIDSADRYLYVNPKFTQMFGYTLTDIPTGKAWFAKAFPDPVYRHKAVSAWSADIQAFKADEARPRTFEVTCRDNTKKIIRFRPVTQSSGNRFVIYEDITNQHRLETQLRQAQKLEAIGTLAGGIAHDFNNILAAVIGFTELAAVESPSGSTQRQHLQRVLKAGERARDLVKQILAFSRQSEPELMPVDLSMLVKETIKLLRATLPTTIEIQQHIKAGAMVLGDPTQMHQVLMNLCTNAGHAMREKGGILEIRIENIKLDADPSHRLMDLLPGPYICLTISDTGHGMPPEVLERIFDPFFTTKEKAEGTGMGLAVAHGIVADSGGKIYAFSEVDCGTTFKVFLPMVERRSDPEQRPKTIIAGGTERILFVDDEPTLVDMGKQMLESFGYAVTTSTSSSSALDLFRSDPQRFDLVITDMTMPTMTGDILARAIMAIRPDIPIILCTGFSASMSEEAAGNLGIRALVMKPILMHQIAGTVRRILDEARLKPNLPTIGSDD